MERCVEFTYDHSPKKLQPKLSAMRKISEKCKEQRRERSLHLATRDDRTTISTEPYPLLKCMANDRITRSRAPKHWFDNDGDGDDKSLHSSDGETTLTGRDEKDEEYV
jgi:hypothetical protein